MVFDIIGDIHGYADRLKSLLKSLGYVESEGAYRHSDQNRRAIFVGDFVDRGPQIPEAVLLVRSMVEAGSALATMGNHERESICECHTPLSPSYPLFSLYPQLLLHTAFSKGKRTKSKNESSTDGSVA